MVDLLTLIMMHMLLALAAWRLLMRPDLDAEREDGGTPEPEPRERA